MATLEVNKKIVTQDNALVRAAYSMSLNEKRLLMLGISKINPSSFPDSTKPYEFKLTAEQWKHHFPAATNAYRDMATAADKLRSKSVTILNEEHKKVLNWVDSCTYNEEQGTVSLRFGYSISVRLAGMVSEFTQYNLRAVEKMNSFHSIRLYELLAQFTGEKGTGFFVDNLDHFRQCMDVSEGQYAKFSDFKRRVIVPAITEINEKSDIEVVSWEALRTGRKVTGIRFSCKRKDQMELNWG